MRKKTNIKILALVFMLSTIILSLNSCKDDTPVVNSTEVLRTITTDENTPDNTVAAFVISSSINVPIQDSPYRNYVWGYLTNGISSFIKPQSITCNGQTMEYMGADPDEGGQYQAAFLDHYPTTISLNVQDYLGANYVNTSNNLPALSLVDVNLNDTINISNGLNLQYSGVIENGNGMEFVLSPDKIDGETALLVGTYTLHKFYSAESGSITIPASEIATFPSGRYNVVLYHSKFVHETFGEYNIVKRYQARYWNQIYIKNTEIN